MSHPIAIIAKLSQQINSTLVDPAFRKRVNDMGVTIMGGTPEEVTSYIASESRKWAEVVRLAGVKVD